MPALATVHQNLKLLADPTRLRLVGLLSLEELAVHELVAVTGLQQSRISNHLALLKRAGLVVDRREGSWSFHRLAEAGAGGLSLELFAAAVQPYLDSDEGRRDAAALVALHEQRRERSRATHDRLAVEWADVGQEFQTGSLRAEALAALAPRQLTVADLGCGAGFLAQYLCQRAARVIAIDHSANMLATARQHLGGDNVELRQGELDALPLHDGEVDAAFANLVWHHVPDMQRAAAEIARVLRPGGTIVITDLLPHDQDWMREHMGDLRLGVRPDVVMGALARAGLRELVSEPIADHYLVTDPEGRRTPLPMFLVRGRASAS